MLELRHQLQAELCSFTLLLSDTEVTAISPMSLRLQCGEQCFFLSTAHESETEYLLAALREDYEDYDDCATDDCIDDNGGGEDEACRDLIARVACRSCNKSSLSGSRVYVCDSELTSVPMAAAGPSAALHGKVRL